MTQKGTALKPDFFFSNMPTMAKEEKEGEPTTEEQQLYSLSKSAGWKILKQHIDNISKDLDNINKLAIEKGAGFDVIGQNAVVINLAKDLLDRIINKIEDAREQCEK